MAAGALVDRAHVQAGRAADAVQRRPPGLVGQGGGAAVVQQHQVELPAARRRASPRSTSRCTGSSARRSTSGAAAAGTPPGPRQVGTTFSMPMTVISVSRQGQAHPAVALGLDHAQRAGLGDGEVRAGDRRPGRTGTSAAGAAGPPRRARPARRSAPGPRRPSRAGRCPGSRRGCGGSPAPGCATAGPVRAGRSARRGRSRRRAMPARGEGLVEADLLGGHRLDLDHLGGPGGADQVGHDRGWPRRRPGPSARSRRAR